MVPSRAIFPVKNYDLAHTLGSGQTFRWRRAADAWTGVIDGRWVRLRQESDAIHAETVAPAENVGRKLAFELPEVGTPRCRVRAAERADDWQWLRHYLQLDVDVEKILMTFPDDQPMRDSVAACNGLRLLRQNPWECLASFICSSTKQIVQIEQIVEMLCQRFGEVAQVPSGVEAAWSFPTVERLAAASEKELRACKLGFRAPYLLATVRILAAGEVDLSQLHQMSLSEARIVLQGLPGVGPKIADCVLLFAYGFQDAFPVDVWIMKALKELYFPKRRPKLPRLRHFSRSYFGPHSGYAQQYLFHYMRTARPPH